MMNRRLTIFLLLLLVALLVAGYYLYKKPGVTTMVSMESTDSPCAGCSSGPAPQRGTKQDNSRAMSQSIQETNGIANGVVISKTRMEDYALSGRGSLGVDNPAKRALDDSMLFGGAYDHRECHLGDHNDFTYNCAH